MSAEPRIRMATGRVEALDVLEKLYTEQSGRMRRLAAAIVLDANLADDIVHDAFIGLQRRLANVESPLGYLHRSVVNGSLKALRRRRSTWTMRVPQIVLQPEIDETWQAVVQLTPRQRTVVVMRFWLDMTEKSIAEQLGWPIGTVKSTLHRALNVLEEELKP